MRTKKPTPKKPAPSKTRRGAVRKKIEESERTKPATGKKVATKNRKTKPRGRTLTAMQRKFVAEYLVDMNAYKACIRAGYSARSADKQASQLLGKPRVKEKLDRAMTALEVRTEIGQDMVVKELARIAFSDMEEFAGWAAAKGVRLKDSDGLNTDQTRAVSEVSETKDGQRLKLHSKTKALELLGKHLGMWIDRQRHEGPDGGPVQATVVYYPKNQREVEDSE